MPASASSKAELAEFHAALDAAFLASGGTQRVGQLMANALYFVNGQATDTAFVSNEKLTDALNFYAQKLDTAKEVD